ncbi:MAG: flagellar biosynthesis protein FliQ [Zavarzinia sp.]|nr:flagellar biosynthesis protein FliQ [Zavarzinia sp.]
MTAGEALDVAREALLTIMLVSAPVMVVALVVGLTISLFQALTQIQEATLSFVPKILAIFAVLLLALPFMGSQMSTFTQQIMSRIADGNPAAPVAAPNGTTPGASPGGGG